MKLYLGDCLHKLTELEDNSVDSIVTDPPYGLSFMGKKWDYDVPSVDIWKECLRVLKPGGHLLSFAGSRTYHRMAVRIEDAGFEIRDQIMWIYGCLSEDTEILTKKGWKHYHKITKDDIYSKEDILVYDTERDIYKWEKPERWYVYPLNEDTLYRIRGNQTDQLVSKDHNCIVERDGKLVFIKSQYLSGMERMPVLSNDFSFLQEEEEQINLLQLPMQRDGQGGGMESVGNYWRRNIQSTRKQKEKSKLRRKEWSLEGWDNLQAKRWLLFQLKNKICKMPRRVQKYVKKGRVYNGVPTEYGNGNRKAADKNGMCTSYRPQSGKQQYLKSNVIQEQLRPQEIRSRASYTTTVATITKETYSGIIFCPNTSTGAFVARRNGKIFLTGNSGFPKSHNIGKAVDKLQGNEREVVGTEKENPAYRENKENHNLVARNKFTGDLTLTKGTSEYEGWGTALKPAHEPIVMARKPLSEKTVVDNVLEWGTGGINIDESRIPTDETIKNNSRGVDSAISKGIYGDSSAQETHQTEGQKLGRFPANIILDEEAGKILDDQSGFSRGDSRTSKSTYDKGIWGNANPVESTALYGDSGGASRFFYCPKTSKTDRNEGLDEFEIYELYDNVNKDIKKQIKSILKIK